MRKKKFEEKKSLIQKFESKKSNSNNKKYISTNFNTNSSKIISLTNPLIQCNNDEGLRNAKKKNIEVVTKLYGDIKSLIDVQAEKLAKAKFPDYEIKASENKKYNDYIKTFKKNYLEKLKKICSIKSLKLHSAKKLRDVIYEKLKTLKKEIEEESH